MAEATQDAAKPARKKNAHYDVWRGVHHDSDDGETTDAWVLIGEEVPAASRREAIAKSAGSPDEPAAYGTFMVVRSGEAKVLTRAKKTIVADDWGAA